MCHCLQKRGTSPVSPDRAASGRIWGPRRTPVIPWLSQRHERLPVDVLLTFCGLHEFSDTARSLYLGPPPTPPSSLVPLMSSPCVFAPPRSTGTPTLSSSRPGGTAAPATPGLTQLWHRWGAPLVEMQGGAIKPNSRPGTLQCTPARGARRIPARLVVLVCEDPCIWMQHPQVVLVQAAVVRQSTRAPSIAEGQQPMPPMHVAPLATPTPTPAAAAVGVDAPPGAPQRGVLPHARRPVPLMGGGAGGVRGAAGGRGEWPAAAHRGVLLCSVAPAAAAWAGAKQPDVVWHCRPCGAVPT
jgi:hypothetical protein